MDLNHTDKIRKSFGVQAGAFENRNMNFTKQEYLRYMLEKIKADKEDTVLEVASGTCICGRSLAHQVKSVVCIDATKEMLEVGKEQALKEKLNNISFVEGRAENLPFENGSFDVVITRLSFHHFTETVTLSVWKIR